MTNRIITTINWVVLILASLLMVACGEDSVDGREKMREGVSITTTEYTVGAEGRTATIPFTTADEFELRKADPENIILEMELQGITTAGKAGQQSLRLKIDANKTDQARNATIYIKVKGYEEIVLVNIKQQTKANDMDEVIKWMDQRLRQEYYWLDEYNDKWQNFDFKVSRKDEQGYNNMLFNNLTKMTTNGMDGGKNSDGSRYIYTNVVVIPSSEYSSTRAGGEETYGYGFDIVPILIQIAGDNTSTQTDDLFAFAVEHVYPSSPAAAAGLRRSDLITMVNNSAITASNYNSIYTMLVYQNSSAISLEKRIYETGEKATINLSRTKFNANPVAYSGVLSIPDDISEEKKDIGYISYISFDAKGDDKLLEAMRDLADKNVKEMIVDLRSNGGGSVNSAVKLSSMLLDESYVGQVCAKLVRNPNNASPYHNTPETRNTVYNFRKTDELTNNIDLPNLNLDRVYFIVSNQTASASEMVITALQGVDVETILIGRKTEGKNCGMDVIDKMIGQNYYSFAPITFLNYNAKDFCEYSSGLKPDTDFDYWDTAYSNYVKNNPQATDEDKAVMASLHYYPIPQSPWGNVEKDLPLREAVSQIFGTSVLTISTRSGEQSSFKPAKCAINIEGIKNLQPISTKRRALGSILTKEERQATEQALNM